MGRIEARTLLARVKIMVLTVEDAKLSGERTAWTRHRGPVTGVVSIPGTCWAVTSAYDGAVGLFDLATGAVELLGYHDHLVNRVVVRDDGAKAASCSSDYSIHIWDVGSRRRERVLLGHSDDVEDFVFVDAETGVSASRDRRIIVWNLSTGAIRRVLAGHEKDVLAVVAAAGKVYSSGDDKTLRVWDLETGAQESMWGPFENETDTCAIDLRRNRAVLGCDDGCIRVFDASTGELKQMIEAHSSGIKKVAVSPTSGDLLSAAYDQKIIVWDSGTFARKVTLEKSPSTWERSLTWSPDGTEILAGTFDGTVLLWDAVTGELEREIGEKGAEPGNPCFNDIAVSSEGRITAVSDDGFVRVVRLSEDEDCWTEKVEPRHGRVLMNAVTASDACSLVVAGCHDHTVLIFKCTAHGLSDEIGVPLDEGPINSLRVASHAGYRCEVFAACYSSRIVRVSPSGEVRARIQVHEGAVKSLRLHPRETIGVSCGADGLLLSWTFEGELLERFLGHTAIINDVDLDPAGRRLASVSRDFTVKIFDVATGRLEHSIPIGRKSLKSVCFWDDETVLIGDYWGGLIRVDLAKETSRRAVVASNGISALARSGQHVAATSYDGAIYLVRPDLTVVRTLRAMRQKPCNGS
jgi:WD40 repeat protein